MNKVWGIVAVLLAGWTLFAIGYAWPHLGTGWQFGALVVSPVILVAGWPLWRRLGRWGPALDASLRSHGDWIDRLPAARVGLAIAAAAGAGLYAELMIIRMHASYFQLFGYFKNVSLLSCFLGLGIGYTLDRRRALFTPLLLPAFAVQILFMHVLRMSGAADVLQNPVSEQLTFGLATGDGIRLVMVYGFLILMFAVNALCFIPFGQLAGRLMRRQPPLQAYGWNLGGSLAGIVVFYLLAYWWMPPAVWLMVVSLVVLAFLRDSMRMLYPSVVAAMVVVAFVSVTGRLTERDIYSPYQILTVVTHRKAPPEIRVNNVYFQRVLTLDSLTAASDSTLARWADHYALPYRFKEEPGRVLVVGAGTGNDVAAALRAGAAEVDAVEIDPAVMTLGGLLHGESPYLAHNVNLIVNDARAFIRHTDRQYDLVVYGLLDSHTLLSGRAGVRLDSYVYTVEAFREARRRLKPGGLMSVTFSLITPELGRKLFLMLTEAFDGREPLIFHTGYDGGFTFLTGEDISALQLPADFTLGSTQHVSLNTRAPVDLSTDDWPFLYMPRRTYPSSYLFLIVMLLGISLLFVRQLVPEARTAWSGPCFFLGAGFMLVETKSITELALVHGSTWSVIGMVIVGILTMAFLANWIVYRRGAPPPAVTYGLLFVSLALGLSIRSVLVGVLPARLEVGVVTLVLTLPLFFSGMAFSAELRRTPVGTALAANLLGAMLGGFLEYNSLYFGFRSLYYVAFALYGVAFLYSFRRGAVEDVAAVEPVPPAEPGAPEEAPRESVTV